MAETETPAGLEDIGAGLVNGVMVTLLGVAVAGLIAWQLVAQLSGWLPDLKALSIALPPTSFKAEPAGDFWLVVLANLNALPLILASFWAIRWGVMQMGQNLRRLRARRS
jgi:hypothetical protein